jgi:hypothetical protein
MNKYSKIGAQKAPKSSIKVTHPNPHGDGKPAIVAASTKPAGDAAKAEKK